MKRVNGEVMYKKLIEVLNKKEMRCTSGEELLKIKFDEESLEIKVFCKNLNVCSEKRESIELEDVFITTKDNVKIGLKVYLEYLNLLEEKSFKKRTYNIEDVYKVLDEIDSDLIDRGEGASLRTKNKGLDRLVELKKVLGEDCNLYYNQAEKEYMLAVKYGIDGDGDRAFKIEIHNSDDGRFMLTVDFDKDSESQVLSEFGNFGRFIVENFDNELKDREVYFGVNEDESIYSLEISFEDDMFGYEGAIKTFHLALEVGGSVLNGGKVVDAEILNDGEKIV